MVHFTSNTYQMKREILNFSSQIPRSKLRGMTLLVLSAPRCGVFGLRSASVGAKRVPPAHSALAAFAKHTP